MPVFLVFRTGPKATPKIWQNDLNAMAGVGTFGGMPAPEILNYGGPGMNVINRRQALKWARNAGIVAGNGQQLDEYPFASAVEGGLKSWVRVAPVAKTEQKLQRDDLRRLLRG